MKDQVNNQNLEDEKIQLQIEIDILGKQIKTEKIRLKKEYEELGRQIEAGEYNWAKTNIRGIVDAMDAISVAIIVIHAIEKANKLKRHDE